MSTVKGLGWPICVCKIGAQRCGIHPKNLSTKTYKILFRYAWDQRVNANEMLTPRVVDSRFSGGR